MERLVETYDTFPDWKTQLALACRQERLDDVRALTVPEAPGQVALRHVQVFEEEQPFGRAKRSAFEDALIPFADAGAASVREALEPLPRPGSRKAKAFLRWLLLVPPDVGGPSCFQAQSLGCLQILLDAGADETAPGWMGLPLVVHAAETGDLDLVRFLVEEKGLDVGARRPDGGYSALHWGRGVPVLRYLVERGADPSGTAGLGDPALAQQVRLGHVDEARYLLSLGKERASHAHAFHWIGCDPELVGALLEGGIPPHQEIPAVFGADFDTLLLHRVLRDGLHEHLKADDEEARSDAERRVTACVRLALEHGFDPTCRDGSRLLAWHIIVDHRPGMSPTLYTDLEARLGAYDGERLTPPGRPSCTCGLMAFGVR